MDRRPVKQRKSRRYPVPRSMQEELGGTEYITLDDMELLASSRGGSVGPWATRVLSKENRKTVEAFLAGGNRMPMALLEPGYEDLDAVSALALDDKMWDCDGWHDVEKSEDAMCPGCRKFHDGYPQAVPLDDDLLVEDNDDSFDEYEDGSFFRSLQQNLPINLDPNLEGQLEPVEPADVTLADQCPSCGAHLHTGRQTMDLSMDDIASVIRAISDGAQAVIFRPYAPVAHMESPMMAAAVQVEMPAGAIPVAVVDELDKNAVLDLLAIAPGPVVYLRQDQGWVQDESWRQTMTSVKPPPVVRLEDPQLLASVVAQVDSFVEGAGRDDEDGEEAAETEEAPVPASALISSSSGLGAVLASIERSNQNAALQEIILGASPAKKVANGAAGAERLRQYWGYGKGAAKIRWGTKGDWRRCVKQLTKYLGPRSKGYCNLLHARVNGAWPNSKNQAPNPATSAEAIAKQLKSSAAPMTASASNGVYVSTLIAAMDPWVENMVDRLSDGTFAPKGSETQSKNQKKYASKGDDYWVDSRDNDKSPDKKEKDRERKAAARERETAENKKKREAASAAKKAARKAEAKATTQSI